MGRLKPLVASAFIALGLLVFGAAPAAAATPCWKTLINDWYDGRIDDTYPTHCYEDAIHHLPEDVQTYSSAKDDINRALLASLRHDRDPGQNRLGEHPVASAPIGGGPSGGGPGKGGPISRVFDWLGPKNADSLPLPLLVLAAVALLLLAAAASSFAARRIQARRVVVQPAPAPPPEHP
jgi:hypothetical protein